MVVITDLAVLAGRIVELSIICKPARSTLPHWGSA
jgi:hypothetical protein